MAVAVLALASLVIGVQHATTVQLICDDAYISYRFAQNLVEGEGLVYNPGERVEGYTNFLWVLLMAVGMGVGLSPEGWSLVVGVVFLVLLFVLLAGMARRICGGWLWASVAVLLLASTGPVILWSVAGLETGCFTALVVLAMVLYHHANQSWRRLALAGLCYALASLTRPEGALFGAMAGLHLVARQILSRSPISQQLRNAGALAGGYLCLMAPFVLWRRVYYGDWLPNTYYVKTGSSIQWELGLDYLRSFATDYPVLWIGTGAGIGFALTLSAYRGQIALLSHLAIATVSYGLYVAKVGGDYMALYRFSVPMLPMMVLFTAVALHAISTTIADSTRRLMPVVALVGLLVLASFSWWLHRPTYASVRGDVPKGTNAQLYMKRNTERWSAVGKTLHKKLWPNARIATTVAGALPFYSQAYTLDQCGLCDRHTAREDSDLWQLHKPGHRKIATRDHLLSQQPPIDVIIGLPLMRPDTPAQLPTAPSEDYRLYKFEVEELKDARGRAIFTYCFLHQSREGDAAQRGFVRCRN